MKLLGLTTAIMMWAGAMLAQTTTNFTFNVNETIPDGSFSGLASVGSISGVDGSISNLTVNLDITGGYNGDLYAYLVGPDGGFAVLLNRVGATGGNDFGYADSGFNITLNDSGSYNNIHYYQTFPYTLTGGQLDGTWASDGENVDPMSNLPGSSSSTATLTSFDNTDPNGNWTLFIADLSGGGTATLLNWGVTMAVPEPKAWMLGMTAVILMGSRRLLLKK